MQACFDIYCTCSLKQWFLEEELIKILIGTSAQQNKFHEVQKQYKYNL